MYKSAYFLALAVATAPSLASFAPCVDGELEMSVQGVSSAFCVASEGCSGSNTTGLCPEPQTGLQYGSYCDLLETDVYGCKPYVGVDQKTTVTYEAPVDCTRSPAGDVPVSIVGAERAYCAIGPVCSGNALGNCPGVQEGLLQASECVMIPSGVYGCAFPTPMP